MKLATWAVTVFLAGLWTLCAAAFAGVASWMGTRGADVIQNMGQGADVALPAWLAVWIPSGWLAPLGESASALLAGMVQVLPWLAALVGWLAPVIWVLWFFGMLLLLALAIGLHWWLSGRQRSAQANQRRFVA